MNNKDNRQVRSQCKAAIYRAVTQVWQYANMLRNMGKRKTLDAEAKERMNLIDKMSNWQRTQYTKQKIKGQEMPLDQLKLIAETKRTATP